MSIQAAADRIYELFEVTREEAMAHAEEFADTVSSFGGVTSAEVIEIQIPKVFGNRLKWRSEATKSEIERKRDATVAAYNSFINSRKRQRW